MPWTFKFGLEQWKPQILTARGLSYTGASQYNCVPTSLGEYGLIIAPMRDETQVPITRVVSG